MADDPYCLILLKHYRSLMAMAQEPRMSMCGYGAVAAMLHAATALGATHAGVLGYSNSGMVEPMQRVVGYASAAILR